MTAFLDLFEPIQKGNFGLTEQAIYWSIQAIGNFVPIWGGNKEHIKVDRLVSENGRTKSGDFITIFEGEGIIISFDGSAGSMTYKTKQRFALNHHAGFFKLKKGTEQKVILEFFALFYQNQLEEESVSEGSKTLTLDQIYSMDLELPSYEVQKEVMLKIQPILLKRQRLITLLEHVDSIKNKVLSINYQTYQTRNVSIADVVDYLSGNSGLTEKEIYQKSQLDGKKYIVLSSSTEPDARLGEISICKINGRKLKIFVDKEGLLIIRIGNAGTAFFLDKGDYTITENAYILYLKEDCKYQISLKWLMIQHRKTFFDYSSTADYGTWNMTNFFKSVYIDIPSFNEQIKVVNKYEKLEKIERKLNSIKSKIDHLFMKKII